MATSPVDLSAGLVPQSPPSGAIDLSGGMVPFLSEQGTKPTKPTFDEKYVAPQMAPANESVGAHIARAASNIGGGVIGAVTSPFEHPIQTAQSIFGMSPGGMAFNALTGRPQVPAQIGNAIAAHPEEALESLGGNMLGGAALGEGVSAIAPSMLGAAGNVAGRVALMGRTPEGAYESALKPSTTIPEAQRVAMVQTGLQNEIPVSKAGLEIIGDLVDDLNQKIKDQIAADPNRPISTVPALRNLEALRGRFANQVTPQPDLSEIQQTQTNFLNNPKIAPQGEGPGPGSLPASEAQTMKQGTYSALGDKAYGELKGASIEAQKALARGLKDEIASQFPEINNLNAAESKLLDLQPVLEKAVSRISNHQSVGIGTPIVGAGVKAATGSTLLGGAAAIYKAVFDNPMVKTHLAIAVSKGSNIPIAQAMARVNAYSSILGASAASTQANSSADNATQAAAPAVAQ